MTVAELIALLQKQDQSAPITVAVGWADDTAISDDSDDPIVEARDGRVVIEGYLPNANGELEILYEDAG